MKAKSGERALTPTPIPDAFELNEPPENFGTLSKKIEIIIRNTGNILLSNCGS